MYRYFCCCLLAAGLPLCAQTPIWPGAAATVNDMLIAADHVDSALAADISSTDLTIPLTTTIPFISVLRITNEQVHVCSVGTNSATVCPGGRGYAGTAAVAHVQTAEVHGKILSIFWKVLQVEMIALETYWFTHTSGTGNGVSPAVNGASWPNHIVTPCELGRAVDDSTGELLNPLGVTDTTITLKASGNFEACEIVQVGSELIKLGGVSGNVLTVAPGGRGYAQSLATSHPADSPLDGPIASVLHNRLATEMIAFQTDMFPDFGGGASGINASWAGHIATALELTVAAHQTVTGSIHNRLGSEFAAVEQTLYIAITTTTARYTVLTWSASTSSGVTGYRVYRGAASGGPYTLLNPTLVTVGTFTDHGVSSGHTYYYVVTAMNSDALESSRSSEVAAVIP